MALKKLIELPSGAGAEYWRVIEVSINVENRVAHLGILGYVSEATRTARKSPLTSATVNVQPEAFDILAALLDGRKPVRAAYMFLKAHEPAGFTDAEDLLDDAVAPVPARG